MAFDDQIAGNGQTGRAGTYHGNFFPCGLGFGRQFTGSILSFPVGRKSFQISDGHRFALFADDAQPFTLNLLGAYPAAYRRKAVLLPDVPDGPGKVPFFNQLDKTRYIDFNRTAGNTVWFFALQAPGGLLHGHLLGVPGGNFQEVPGPYRRFLFGHCHPGNFFFLHFFLGYFCHNYLPLITLKRLINLIFFGPIEAISKILVHPIKAYFVSCRARIFSLKNIRSLKP
jgi:hypothetical protein